MVIIWKEKKHNAYIINGHLIIHILWISWYSLPGARALISFKNIEHVHCYFYSIINFAFISSYVVNLIHTLKDDTCDYFFRKDGLFSTIWFLYR